MYKKGKFREEVQADKCYALALIYELDDAKEEISKYNSVFNDGKYSDKLHDLDTMIEIERSKSKKSLWISVTGSIVIPGFSHFYTGNYTTGLFSLFTNAALIYLIYDGYRDGDRFQMFFFSFLELSFYQHSLYSSVRNVYEYNSKSDFRKHVRMAITEKF